MEEISRLGIDLAKSAFQLHAVDASEQVVLRRRLSRSQLLKLMAGLAPCDVGMEACAMAHWWARQFAAMGHRVKLVPPAYVKPYVQRNKSDAADAAAICEAMARPAMRCVPIKSEQQQAVLALHRVREGLVRERTSAVNRLRALVAEFGLVAGSGRLGMAVLLARAAQMELPEEMRLCIEVLQARIVQAEAQIATLEKRLQAQARQCPQARLLQSIPGIGPLTASALLASIGDVGRFQSARHLAAWIGLTPRLHQTGKTRRLGSISKKGDPHLRRLLVLGASARLMALRTERNQAPDPWLDTLSQRKAWKLAAVAAANKTTRIVWAVLSSGQPYRRQPAA